MNKATTYRPKQSYYSAAVLQKKKKLQTFITRLLVVLSCLGCKSASAQSFDLEFKGVTISNIDNFMKNVKPNIADTTYNEIDDVKQCRVKYKSSEFFFNIQNGILNDYMILDSEFTLVSGNIGVNDNATKIISTYHNFTKEENNFYIQGEKDYYVIFTIEADKIVKIQLFNL